MPAWGIGSRRFSRNSRPPREIGRRWNRAATVRGGCHSGRGRRGTAKALGKADWDDSEWVEALSMGALTVHLAAPASLDEARRRFRQRLNSRKVAALGENG